MLRHTARLSRQCAAIRCLPMSAGSAILTAHLPSDRQTPSIEQDSLMTDVTITLHLRAYRERALMLQPERREAELAYDANIHDYVKYLSDEAAKPGYVLTTDHGTSAAYSIQAPTHDAKKAAHDWLDTLPDIWNWIP